MAIVIRFTPQRVDLVASGLAGVRARPAIAVTSVLFFVVLPWSAAILSLVALAMGKAVPLWSIAVFVLTPPIAVAGMLLMPIFLFGRSPALLGEHRYEFSEDQMSFVGPAFDNKLQWHIVTRYMSSRLGTYLFSEKLPLVSIPKRALTPAVTNELHELFARKGLRRM